MNLFFKKISVPAPQEELRRVCEELRRCDSLFAEVSAPQLTEYCVYRRLSLLAQYSYLLGQLKSPEKEGFPCRHFPPL